MHTAELCWLNEEDYLQGELTSQLRHEYVAGQIFAMVGASKVHNLISANLLVLLRAHLRQSPCRVFMMDMKVHITRKSAYYYPDIIVTCDPHDIRLDKNPYFVRAPCLIIEVLSPATAGIDQREKLLAYQTLASLQEYVIVNQAGQQITVYRRTDSHWVVENLVPDDILRLSSIGLNVTFAELYEQTDVPTR